MNDDFRDGIAGVPGECDDVESLLGRSRGDDAVASDGYRDRVISAMEAAATERRRCVALRAVAPAERPSRRAVVLASAVTTVAGIVLPLLIVVPGVSTAEPAGKPLAEAIDGGGMAADAPADVQRALDLLEDRRDRLMASPSLLADATR